MPKERNPEIGSDLYSLAFFSERQLCEEIHRILKSVTLLKALARDVDIGIDQNTRAGTDSPKYFRRHFFDLNPLIWDTEVSVK